MAIPEDQLETWARQGSIAGSAETYEAIRTALQDPKAAYAKRPVEIFLQGSYANATNIYGDSDVDVVIRLDDCFYWDESSLPPQLQATRAIGRAVAPYRFAEFRRDVIAQLQRSFLGVKPGDKAVFVPGDGQHRRDADVLVSVTYRDFFIPAGQTGVHYWEGVCFFTPTGAQIVNYPKLHAAQCTAKHQATNGWFKPTVRIFKNMRNRAVRDGLLAAGAAPSYFLEGMLHNVPDALFGRAYGATVMEAGNWLAQADSAGLLCANQRYLLLHESSPVTWREAQFTASLDALASLWNGW